MFFLPVVGSLLFGVTLKVGDKAPDFTVQDTDNKSHALAELIKHGPVILAFFPKAFTGG